MFQAAPRDSKPLRRVDGEVAFVDSLGSVILDPWNTANTGVGGFDLDAVGGRYIRDASYAEVLLANMFRVGTNRYTGDLNGDGVTDGADLNRWNAIDFVDPRNSPTMVPEPIGSRMWAITVLLWLCPAIRRLAADGHVGDGDGPISHEVPEQAVKRM